MRVRPLPGEPTLDLDRLARRGEALLPPAGQTEFVGEVPQTE
jgi:hypothetical protein